MYIVILQTFIKELLCTCIKFFVIHKSKGKSKLKKSRNFEKSDGGEFEMT